MLLPKYAYRPEWTVGRFCIWAEFSAFNDRTFTLYIENLDSISYLHVPFYFQVLNALPRSRTPKDPWVAK